MKYTYREILTNGIKAVVREETLDEYVVNEIIRGDAYRKLNIYNSDIVLDIGLNIGMFTIKAIKAGATVHAYEPDPDNFDIAELNIELNEVTANATLYQKAIVGTKDTVRSFSLNVKKNKGAHSLIAKRGRETITVKCVNINDVMAQIQPTIIKMDIEGGEYEVIKDIKSFDGVRELILEFHHTHLNDIKTQSKFREIVGILQTHFNHVDYKKEPKKSWTTLIYCCNLKTK